MAWTQLRRAGDTGRPVGLDWSAVLGMAEARGMNCRLLAQVLPTIERVIVDRLTTSADGEADG